MLTGQNHLMRVAERVQISATRGRTLTIEVQVP